MVDCFPRGVSYQLSVVQARAFVYVRLDLCLVSTYHLYLQYFQDKKIFRQGNKLSVFAVGDKTDDWITRMATEYEPFESLL